MVSKFELRATWGSLQVDTTSEHLIDTVIADSEDEVRAKFKQNIVNRFYGREILAIRKIRDL